MNSFKLLELDQSIINAPVLNLEVISDYVWLDLTEAYSEFQIYDVVEVSNHNTSIFDLKTAIIRCPGSRYVKLLTKLLNTSIGFHMYQFKLIHKITNSITSLFWAYNIQSNYPYRPYIYIEDDSNEFNNSKL